MSDDDKPFDLPPTGPSEATAKLLRQAVADEMRPVRSHTVQQRALAVLIAALASVALVMSSYGRESVRALNSERGAIALAALGALTVATLVVATLVPRLQRALGRSGRLLLAASVIGGWALFLWVFADGEACSGSELGIGCGLRALGGGLVATVATMWAWRKTDPWAPRAGGAIVGAAAGSIACAAVNVACATTHAGHIIVGHWLAVPLLAIVGALTARRVLSP